MLGVTLRQWGSRRQTLGTRVSVASHNFGIAREYLWESEKRYVLNTVLWDQEKEFELYSASSFCLDNDIGVRVQCLR